MTPGQPVDAPAVGDDESPLATLAACHRHLLTQCAVLQRLIDPQDGYRPDRPACDAVHGAVCCRDTALQPHHADEEVELFPALIDAMAGSDAVCLREMVASLTEEHRDLERRWRLLRPTLDGLAAGRAPGPAADELQAFVDRCQRHVAREDAELLPMAGRLIGDAELTRIGDALRTRCPQDPGVGPSPTDSVSDWPSRR
ncbi:hemerythrin domain-containing protein [Ideonella sp. A 288]|uniref:hemerythrin domain-containing protein n=1 Tax=Ideonella sp. A 288 TaxID=1962181 RepID=UPI000B4C11BC|nr:hemerythrin domain-containing protein [Ideonella sp. A 288]